jgi:SAM-dependent methyltransferase
MTGDYREIADFYDFEYPDVDYLGPDVDFFLEHIPGGHGDPYDVLELGCGTGRATRAMAEAGHRVTGVDVDSDLLAIARAKQGGPRYVEADLSLAGWNGRLPDAKWDAACCFFNTFLALARPEAQEACLEGCHRLLQPDGLLWLDVFHPNLDLVTGAVGGVDELEPSLFTTSDGRSVMRTTSLYADVTRQIQHVTFNYDWFEDGERQQHSRGFEMAWIMPREMERLLRLCGFQIMKTFGDYDGSPISDDSERQIVLARRL